MNDMNPALTAAFDPEAFRRLGHGVVDRLAAQLAQVHRREGPVLPDLTPEAACLAWPGNFPAQPGGEPLALLEKVLAASNQLHHPRYVGHQVTSPLPWSALVDFVGAFLNNGTAIFEMGPASTAMERGFAKWFAGRVGYDPQRADGFLTHGGSAGNLTAMLAARQHAAPWDVWEEGVGEGGKLRLICSDQTHYSARRSAQVMGLGAKAVDVVPTDGAFRMRPDALRATLEQARRQGQTIIAVAASAGSTATGAIDPLEAIADLCAEFGVWFHVDAAHGGGLALSDGLRGRLKGLERSDSLVLDAHKVMLTPALATLVLFREGDRSFETFSQSASYLFGADPRETWYDLAQRTLECTKRMLGLQVYASLQVMGTAFFADYVEQMVDLTQRFAQRIQARPHWAVATEPDCNILCFRYAPPHLADAEAFQSQVRERIVKEGSFYLVKTKLAGQTWLRTTLINPCTELGDLEALLDRVEAEAKAT
ncbi:MAG: aminotransferase class V-fold PLP-dependent enzyme [Holophaga sp.]|nr:aminotransferase class V-fold PLP-dependent enzyme [Holophaga sp.]